MEKIKQKDNQLEQLQLENARLRNIEANFENVQVKSHWSLILHLFVHYSNYVFDLIVFLFLAFFVAI